MSPPWTPAQLGPAEWRCANADGGLMDMLAEPGADAADPTYRICGGCNGEGCGRGEGRGEIRDSDTEDDDGL